MGLNDLSQARVWLGRDEPPAPPRRLKVRRLEFDLDGIDVRNVRRDGEELINRIYVGVRDTNWDTLPPTVSGLDVRTAPDGSVEVSFDAFHEGSGIRFRWHGTISARADGSLSYEMDGRAEADFRHNRIGFCVLHPASAAGRPYRAMTAAGTAHGVLPELIEPQRVVDGVETPLFPACSSLSVELDGQTVTTDFEGDLFEMEDQRNWTDASFKTYCTPIGLGYPHEATRGQSYRQRVTLTSGGAGARTPRPAQRAQRREVEIGAGGVRSWPDFGLGSATGLAVGVLGRRDRRRLRALALDHLRVDLRLSKPDWTGTLERAYEQAHALDCRLEVALFVSEATAADLSHAAARLADQRVARVIALYEPTAGTATTPGPWFDRIAAAIASAPRPRPPVLTGTDGDFAELNRDRPHVTGAGVAYSVNPQIHAFDELSLVESLPIQALTVASARTFTAGLVTLSPVTLRQRFNPAAAEPAPDRGVEPLVDPRQPSLFGAGWTLGSIASLVAGGADAVTWFETAGPRGVIGPSSGGQTRGSIPAGSVYPSWFVLADLADRAAWRPLLLEGGTGPAWTGLAMEAPGRLRVLLANVTAQPLRLALGPVDARSARVRILDAGGALAALAAPARFRASGERRTVTSGRLDLDLEPFGYARVDARTGRTSRPGRVSG